MNAGTPTLAPSARDLAEVTADPTQHPPRERGRTTAGREAGSVEPEVQHFDLIIIGSGSGNSIPDQRFDGLTIALVDQGVFGGTCLNVGCIPTKMFVHPADLAASRAHGARVGVDLELRAVRFAEIRDRIFGRIDPISESGLAWRSSNRNVTVFQETAHFLDPHRLPWGRRRSPRPASCSPPAAGPFVPGSRGWTRSATTPPTR